MFHSTHKVNHIYGGSSIMLMGIFVESNEDLGLLYQSYKDIPAVVKEFLKFIEKTVDYALNEGIPKEDIDSRLKEFKTKCKTSMIKPIEVGIKDLSELIPKIKDTKSDVDHLLQNLGSTRKKFRFGDNLIRGIIIKPKIYRNTIDENELEQVNTYMRKAAVSLDWIEKVILDLMNMCDQDLNLASVMKSVYYRECHDTSDFMEEFNDPIIDPMNDEIE